MWDATCAIKSFLVIIPYLTVSSSFTTCLLPTWLTTVQERAHYNKIALEQQLSTSDQTFPADGWKFHQNDINNILRSIK